MPTKTAKAPDYKLPFDYFRCPGYDSDVCKKCLRTTPGRPMYQTYMHPVMQDGTCEYLITNESYLERLKGTRKEY